MSGEIVQAQQYTVTDLERMATAIAKSNLFGVKTVDQALALMLLSQAEGLHPAIAARDYHIVDGKPALKADAILARFQQAGGSVRWLEYSDTSVLAEFSHPRGGTVSVGWDMARAKQAELGGKANWKKYPRQMLRARVISEGVRTVFPSVLAGMYTPEEVQDFEPDPRPSPKAEDRTTVIEGMVVEEATESAPPVAGTSDVSELATAKQFGKIQALFGDLGLAGDEQRDTRLFVLTSITGQPIASSKDLTKTAASAVIEALTGFLEAVAGAGVKATDVLEAYSAAAVDGHWEDPKTIVNDYQELLKATA